MRVVEISLRRFRGFEDLTFQPRGHVALLGEPRAGRSDLIEGLRRVLTSEAVRYTAPSELDFWMLDVSARAEVEVVLGDLGSELEQDLVDHLERWDADAGCLAAPRPPTAPPTSGESAWVVRLCYRVEWDAEHERAVHWVDFPDESDPAAGTFVPVPRRLHDLLPVLVVGSRGRALGLAPRSDFRRLLDGNDGGTLGTAFEAFVDEVRAAGETLATDDEIKASVENVLEHLEGPLGVDPADPSVINFAPEGGSLSGLLRSLQPALNLGPPGHLPLEHHGSTAAALVRVGEAIALLGATDGVVLVDDFGEDLDAAAARHLGSVLCQRSGQAWISTRRSSAAEALSSEEIVRLYLDAGVRRAAQLDRPSTKAERIAARHLSLQLLPAASSRVVAIVEGPHDRAALDALARRRLQRSRRPLPAAYGITIIDAGVVDGSGGASAVARLAALAKGLGFHVIGVIDGDPGADGATALSAARSAADRVIRLPDGFAIERALIEGLPDTVVRETLATVAASYGITPPADLATLTGPELLKAVIGVLKKSGGLHAQFVELLPTNQTSRTIRTLLDAIIGDGQERAAGLNQL